MVAVPLPNDPLLLDDASGVQTFASVVVDVDAPGLRQPFTYRVPDHLVATLAPGAAIVVPFGKRPAIGWVIGLSHRVPDNLEARTIRDVLAPLVGNGATLPPTVLQTAQWMARTYLADLAQCVRGLLPDAQLSHLVRRIVFCDRWEAALAATTATGHRAVILALSSFPPTGATEDELQKAVGGGKIDSPLRLLRERGVVADHWSLEPPRVSARSVRTIRLAVDAEEAERQVAQRQTRAAAQARLLRSLLETTGTAAMPQAELLALAETSAATVKRLVSEGLIVAETIETLRRPMRHPGAGSSTAGHALTAEQTVAVAALRERIESCKQNVALLYGVTASGKTEVYLQAIGHARRLGRGSLVLVPEIALTAQVVETFRTRVGDRVAVLHSGLSEGERRDEWQRIGTGAADVVVGARSAVFAPLANIGLIVVDEEHEGSYKQDNPSPRYHARDVAIARARATGATVLLGSATPSVETFHRAESGEWGLLPLRQRALARPLPTVAIVDLREGYRKGEPPASIFSPVLRDAIEDRLSKGEQTILFLNRRGFAIFLLCRDCGYTTRCPNCDVSLTYHARALHLACHHCGFKRSAPTICPSCHGDRIRPFGFGTEKVEDEVHGIFPDARIVRMDRDTTARKNSHQDLLRTFRKGEADILIGTQMIAKGLDFAGVTLVGVVSADTALNLPDFRASERAFQLLTQVSGRAGRGDKPGHVIVQTFNPEHESVVAAARHDYDAFYRQEIVHRRELAYPPFTRLANIVSQDEDSTAAERRLLQLAERLGVRPETPINGTRLAGDDDVLILGPAPCPLSRLRQRFRWHLLLKAADPEVLRTRLRAALHGMPTSDRLSLNIDIDPMSLL